MDRERRADLAARRSRYRSIRLSSAAGLFPESPPAAAGGTLGGGYADAGWIESVGHTSTQDSQSVHFFGSMM